MPGEPKPLHRAAAATGLAAAGVIVALAAAESGLWILGLTAPGGIYMADSEAGYVHRPGAAEHAVRINAMGLRGPEWPEPGAPGEHRILMLGDSFVFGDAIEDESLPALTAAWLEHGHGGRAIAANGGTSGYNLRQSNIVLTRLLRRMTVDAVVAVVYAGNDIQETARDERLTLHCGRLLAVGEAAKPCSESGGLRVAGLVAAAWRTWRERAGVTQAGRCGLLGAAFKALSQAHAQGSSAAPALADLWREHHTRCPLESADAHGLDPEHLYGPPPWLPERLDALMGVFMAAPEAPGTVRDALALMARRQALARDTLTAWRFPPREYAENLRRATAHHAETLARHQREYLANAAAVVHAMAGAVRAYGAAQGRDVAFLVVIAPAEAHVDHGLAARLGAPMAGFAALTTAYYEALDRAFAAGGIRTLNLYPILRRHAEAGEKLYIRYNSHWNALGTLIASEAIAQALDGAPPQP